MDLVDYFFYYDIEKKEEIEQCNLYPTEVNKLEREWLCARNNKYGDESSVDREKIGKWMLFPAKDVVNDVWDKIKSGIVSGELWSSKVSTNDPSERTHAIMIYTKDYTDLNDVINVLDYLERSGIKSSCRRPIIYYKTDQQTSAGIYRGGSQKPWIYSSDKVRGTVPPRNEYLSWRKPAVQ